MVPLKQPYQYVIDSSALFDLKNQYPERIFPGVWDQFNAMVEDKLIVAPREVLKEIKKGNDELIEWAERYEDNFLEPTDEEYYLVQEVLKLYPQAILDKYSIRAWADPFVIACARHYGLPIIQHEKNYDPNQFKIPTIAKKYDLKCQTLIEFFDDENWSFS